MVLETNTTQLLSFLPQNDLLLAAIAAMLVIITAFIVFKVLKSLIVNAIIGGIGLILMHFAVPFFLGIQVPLSITNIIIALVAGLPGLIIIGAFIIIGL